MFRPMRPSVASVRKQPEVMDDHCLKAYLLLTFRKRIDLVAADKFLSTFKTQKARQACSTYIDLFITKFEYYATIQWTAEEREAEGHLELRNAVKLRYIREGPCKEFRAHLDNNQNIQTLIQIDNKIIRWSRDTVDWRKFTNACDKIEAKHTAFYFCFSGLPINFWYHYRTFRTLKYKLNAEFFGPYFFGSICVLK